MSLKAASPVELTGKVLRDRIDASDFVYRVPRYSGGWPAYWGEVSTTTRNR